jgi:hypothetical protein
MKRIIGLFFLLSISIIFCNNNTPTPRNNSNIEQNKVVHDTIIIHDTIYNNEFCNDFLFDLTQLVSNGKMNKEYIRFPLHYKGYKDDCFSEMEEIEINESNFLKYNDYLGNIFSPDLSVGIYPKSDEKVKVVIKGIEHGTSVELLFIDTVDGWKLIEFLNYSC